MQEIIDIENSKKYKNLSHISYVHKVKNSLVNYKYVTTYVEELVPAESSLESSFWLMMFRTKFTNKT
jgi:hypothetical protein